MDGDTTIIALLVTWGIFAPLFAHRWGYTSGSIDALKRAIAILREDG